MTAAASRVKLIQGLIDIASPTSTDGQRHVAINSLYEIPLDQVEPILMQIVHVTVTHDTCYKQLRKYLLHLCSQSVYIGLRLSWIMDSISASFPTGSIYLRNVVEMTDMLENAIINRNKNKEGVPVSPTLGGKSNKAGKKRRSVSKGASTATSGPTSPLDLNVTQAPRETSTSSAAQPPAATAQHENKTPISTPLAIVNESSSDCLVAADQILSPVRVSTAEDDTKQQQQQHQSEPQSTTSPATPVDPINFETDVLQRMVIEKELRCTQYNDERWFVKQITQISHILRLIPDRSKREGQLHIHLVELNEKLKKRRVFLPISSTDKTPRWIVNIVWEKCLVFSSRERAPYMLVLETVAVDGNENTNQREERGDQNLAGSPGGPLDPNSKSGDDNLIPKKNGDEGSNSWDDEDDEDDDTYTTLQDPRPHFKTLEELIELNKNTLEVPTVHSRQHSRVLSMDTAAADEVSLLNQVYGESNSQRKEKIRLDSSFGRLPGWDCTSVIVKAGDDLRQEELALQLIALFNTIWKEAGCTACVHPYTAISTHTDCGVIECVVDAASIDSVKKKAKVQSLHQYFTQAYGGEDTKAFTVSQRNFIESMAGYSVVCYLIQIKDRHNANLMLSRSGTLVHIDFGFMLATSPGGINFESAPFKLSQELVDVMGGVSSSSFDYFKVCVWQALMSARERADEVLALISLMIPSTDIPCFGSDPSNVLQQVRQRFRLELTDVEMALVTKELILNSVDNWRTRKYDQFQTLQNGIV